jgi:hypothetical protein
MAGISTAVVEKAANHSASAMVFGLLLFTHYESGPSTLSTWGPSICKWLYASLYLLFIAYWMSPPNDNNLA